MAKKKPACKRCGKSGCKPPKASPPPSPVERVVSEPVAEVPNPKRWTSPPFVPRDERPQPSAFWRPALAKPRWDWIGVAVAMAIICLMVLCRPAKGDVRVDVAWASGGVTVDVGRDGVDVDLSRSTPRPPHVPWWIRGPHWGPQRWRHSPHYEQRGHQHGGKR